MTAISLPLDRIEQASAPGFRWWPGLAVLVLAVAAQCVFFTGVTASDDLGYVRVGRLHAAGEAIRIEADVMHALYYSRVVNWLPIRWATLLLPNHAWAIALPSMLATAWTLIVMMHLGRASLGAGWSWVPAALYAGIPVTMGVASTAFPDVIGTALAWTGIALSAGALLKREARYVAWRCAAAGFLIAMGYGAKEPVAILLPSLALFVLLYRRRSAWAWLRLGGLMLGAGCWLALEALLYWYWTGDALFHAHAVSASQQPLYNTPQTASWSTLLGHWVDYAHWLADPRSQFGAVGLLLLAGMLFAVCKRVAGSRRTDHGRSCSQRLPDLDAMLICLILPGVLYLSVGSPSLRHYEILNHQPRYLLPFLPAMALLTALAAGTIWSSGRWIRRSMVSVGMVAVLLSVLVTNEFAARWYLAKTFRACHDVLAHGFPSSSGGPLYASFYVHPRVSELPGWTGCPEIEVIDRPPPVSCREWVERYGGAYVLTTRFDHHGPRNQRGMDRTLAGAPMDALRQFERTARAEPPHNRLELVIARLLNRPAPTDAHHAAEVYHVPTLDEWTSAGRSTLVRNTPEVSP